MPIIKLFATVAIFLALTTGATEKAESLTGYIEGDYRTVNAPQSGWIEQCDIEQGQSVAVGDWLFRLDSDDAQLAVARAEAQLAQAQANWQNLQSGVREQELQSLRSQRQEAVAQLALAKQTLTRYQKLLKSQAVSAMRVDEAHTNVEVLTAEIASIDDNLQARALAARSEVIAAAEAGVQSAKIVVQQAQSQLKQRQIHSRLHGKITQVYRFSGEFVVAGTPILQVLPDTARKVIFFVPQADMSAWRVGQKLTVTADSGATATATLSHIADALEYTPPMIYSENARGDMVFRLTARLDAAVVLPVGLPVEISR